MKRLYVNKRSELSLIKEAFEQAGANCYRTRIKCECDQPASRNSRDGIIVAQFDRVILEVVRCRGCTKSKNHF